MSLTEWAPRNSRNIVLGDVHKGIIQRIAGELLPAGRSRKPDHGLRRPLQPSALSREPGQSNPSRRLLRPRANHSAAERKDQAKDHRTPALATSQSRRLKCQPRWARASAKSACHLSQIIRRWTLLACLVVLSLSLSLFNWEMISLAGAI